MGVPLIKLQHDFYMILAWLSYDYFHEIIVVNQFQQFVSQDTVHLQSLDTSLKLVMVYVSQIKAYM